MMHLFRAHILNLFIATVFIAACSDDPAPGGNNSIPGLDVGQDVDTGTVGEDTAIAADSHAAADPQDVALSDANLPDANLPDAEGSPNRSTPATDRPMITPALPEPPGSSSTRTAPANFSALVPQGPTIFREDNTPSCTPRPY